MRVALGKRRIEAVTEPGEGVVIHAEGGISTNQEREFSVSVDLAPAPDPDWLRVWQQQDVPLPVTELAFEGDRLVVVVADSQLERAWEGIVRRVEATNAVYANELLPAREAAARLRDAQTAARGKAIAEAQRRVDALEPAVARGDADRPFTGEVRPIRPDGEPLKPRPTQEAGGSLRR